jgi:uncharacterized protein GlcG (DUF336 family)
MSIVRNLKVASFALAAMAGVLATTQAAAASCPVTFSQLKTKLTQVVASTRVTGDIGLAMWGVVVNRGGVVCAVAFSGSSLSSQWLGSRQIAAAKAFTTNAFSTSSTQAFTTADLFGATQDAQPLSGLANGNPLDTGKAYKGPQNRWGTAQDPMVGQIVGGTITFGGGTPLVSGTSVVGGVGVSGDTAARDQAVSDALADALGF